MKPRLALSLALVGLIGSGVTLAFNARAQQPPPGGPAAAEHAEKHMPHFSAEDRAAFLDARIAALHAGLELTPDQAKLWPPVESALRNLAKTVTDIRTKWLEDRPTDPVAILRRISENQSARGAALKSLADAAAPLYASLSEEQKHRLPLLSFGLRHHLAGGHFALGGPGPHEYEHHGWWHWRGGEEHEDHAGPGIHHEPHEEDEGETHHWWEWR